MSIYPLPWLIFIDDHLVEDHVHEAIVKDTSSQGLEHRGSMA